jgi:DNA-binding transcriptional ArsR family regulator
MSDTHEIEALKAVAHPARLRILQTLRAGELNVGDIEAVADIGQPALSQQLAVLRKAGLVTTRKHAKLVYYRLAQAEFDLLSALMSGFGSGDGTTSQPRRTPTPGVANFARLS